MSLPGDLTTVQAQGTFLDAEGTPMRGQVTFTPTATLTDASGEVIIPQFPRTYPLFDGTFLTDPMVATDSGDISPAGWAYDVTIELQAVPAWTITLLLPHSGSPIDISTLLPTSGTPYLPGYLPVTGGALSGTLTLDGSPPLRAPGGAAAGDLMTSDGSGNGTWQPLSGASFPAATSSSSGVVELNTDLGGTATAPHVVATHLASPLPLAQGGTAGATQQAAVNALTGTQSAGHYLRSDGTNASLGAIQAADVPTLNQSTTGTAAGLSSTLALSSGGTGQTSAQAAMDALAGAQTSGDYLRGNGTHVVMAAIAAADLPAATGSTQGAVILDGTGTDIQATGTQSAGGSVTTHAAYADHIHPGPAWIPSDSGLLAANFDPFMTAGAASPMSAGLIYFLQVQVRYSFTWTNVAVMVTSIGSGTSTGCFAGLYNSSGTRVAVSADCASYFTASPVAQYIPMTAPYTTTAGTFLWVALLCNLSSTQVSLAKNSIGNQGNVGYPIASNPVYLRAAKYTTNSQTALPSSFTPSSALSSSGETAFWAGAS